MRSTALLLAASAIMAVSPALAQQAVETSSPAQTCTAFVAGMNMLEKTPATKIESFASGCRLSDVYANLGPYTRYRIARITVSAQDLFDSYVGKRLPTEGDLKIEGLVLAPNTGDPHTSYIVRAQSEPMDIHLAYRLNMDARTAELADFSIAAGPLGGFRITGRFSDVELDPDRLSDASAPPGIIDRLTLELHNARFFTAYVVPALVNLMPGDTDPEPLIENYKQAAIAFIEALPAQNIADSSKAALNRFVSDFPRPSGSYTVEVTADPGLALSQLTADSPIALVAALSRLQIGADHAEPLRP